MRLTACKGYSPMISRYGEHMHDGWELVLQIVGNVSTVVGDQTFLLSPGDLMVIPPRTLHHGEGIQEFRDFSMHIKELPDFPQAAFVVQDTDGMIGQWLEMILKVYTEREPYYEQIIESLINSIFYAIKKKANTNRRYPFVEAFKQCLYENLSNSDFSVGDAISAMGYHPDYFRRCFKHELHASPLEYLTDLRIRRARELLLQDSFNGVEDVAMQCGFVDSFYFSTCFKKREGISPLAFRKTRFRT